eukprot:gene5587-7227_t
MTTPSLKDVFTSEKFVSVTTASAAVGFVGVLPLLLLPFNTYRAHTPQTSMGLRAMVAASCGGLLANTCLHLLPECFDHLDRSSPKLVNSEQLRIGMWIFWGILSFFVLERLSEAIGHRNTLSCCSQSNEKHPVRSTLVYLNVLVNGLDNILHGAAIAASFCTSYKTGLLTTAAVITHEIPHELGDYAILVRSGVRWQDAFLLQVLTSSFCVIGAHLGLYMDLTSTSNVILPFTAGGFLYIALVSLLPDLLIPPTIRSSVSYVLICDVGAVLLGALSVALTLEAQWR